MNGSIFIRTRDVMNNIKKKFVLNKMPKNARQKGASPLMIVIGVVALLGVIASLFVGGSGTGNISSQGSASGYASDIIQQGVAFRDAFDMKVSQGVAPSSVIVADDKNMAGTAQTTNATTSAYPTNATHGAASIFYQGDGMGLPQPKLNLAAFLSTSPKWTVGNSIAMPGVGTASGDYVIGIAGLKSGVCSAINKTLYNTPSIPILAVTLHDKLAAGTDTILPLGVTDNLYTTFQNETTPPSTAQLNGAADPSFATSYPSGVLGWSSGCYVDSSAGTEYIFVQVLSAN